MDWTTAILSGLFTGMGVIFAQKFVNWLDKHPLVKYFKDRLNHVAGAGDESLHRATARGRLLSDDSSLHDLMQQQRDLGKKIEEKITGAKRRR
jgi:hypothetical protein